SAERAAGVTNTRGLYYQFGRKDPFPAASVGLYNVSGTAVSAFTATPGDCIVRVEGKTEIKTAVQYPFNFYYPGSTGDWVSNNPYYNNSWNNPAWHTSSTGKSLFDPCPPGWKLPVNGTWNTFALPGTNTPNAANYPGDYKSGNDQAGWELYMSGSSGETVYYPAAGCRIYTTGTMNGEWISGYYWSSTPHTTIVGVNCSFSSSYMYPQNTSYRSQSFSVRCIQE
ncbi:MAG: fibrobacter succinogenes major paralogous domain-containing protein, partial [Odoribacteraceae bacterium]|nr:fibrobacter succinogenes major paralogous domain-containing protein [Odoribacteraceae bacterium]